MSYFVRESVTDWQSGMPTTKHLMANNSASGEVILCTWCLDLWMMDPLTHVCVIAMTMSFLMLASVMINAWYGDSLASLKALLRVLKCTESVLWHCERRNVQRRCRWHAHQGQIPSNEGMTWFRRRLTSVIGLLSLSFCFSVRCWVEKRWGAASFECWVSTRESIVWYLWNDAVCRWWRFDKFLEMEVDNPAGLLRTVRGPMLPV